MRLPTMAEALQSRIMDIRAETATLLSHSELRHRSHSNEFVRFVGPENHWEPLATEWKALQGKLRNDVGRWFALLSAILADQTSAEREAAANAKNKVVAAIEQRTSMWQRSVDDVARDLWKTLDALMEEFQRLYSEHRAPTFVPDTNALLHNPALETWRFADNEPFRLVLTPTVLSELDELKEGRLGKTRASKAAKLVRQINEYGRRGVLLDDGVPLLRGVSTVVSIATEPRMDITLPWLDRTVSDDRLVASLIEIVRRQPLAPAALVTRDANLKNKATMAGLPCVLPPDPPVTRIAAKGKEPR